MPELYAKMAGIVALRSTESNDGVQVRFRDAKDQHYIIELPLGLLGGFIISLEDASRAFKKASGQEASGQPLTLLSGRGFRLGDGRVGLELSLDNGVCLPVLFPKSGIPALCSSLKELEARASDTSGPTAH